MKNMTQLTVTVCWGGGVSAEGGVCPGVSDQGVCLGVYPSMHRGRHPPTGGHNSLTHACENINLPQLRCGL